MNENIQTNIKIKSCNEHIGGFLGEALLKFFLKEKLIQQNDNDYDITQKGWEELEIIGVDINKLQSNNKKNVKICIESNHGILYEHIGSNLGNLLMERMLELQWIKKNNGNKLELTKKGLTGLESMGVRIKSFVLRKNSKFNF